MVSQQRPRSTIALLLAACACLALATDALGQGRRGGLKGGARGDDRGTPGTTGGDRGAPGAEGETGSNRGSVMKYAPLSEPEDGVVGTLTIRPDNGKILKLEVRDSVRLDVNGKAITPEEFAPLLMRGLRVDVNWTADKRGSKKIKVLGGLKFETITVEGNVIGQEQKGEDVFIRVRAKPKGETDWPVMGKSQSRSGRGSEARAGASKKKVTNKLLNLKYVEETSQLLDALDASIPPSQVQEDQRVEAEIVFGGRFNLLIKGKILDQDEESGAPTASTTP